MLCENPRFRWSEFNYPHWFKYPTKHNRTKRRSNLEDTLSSAHYSPFRRAHLPGLPAFFTTFLHETTNILSLPTSFLPPLALHS